MIHFMKILNNISRSQATFRSERLKAEGLWATHHSFVLAICRCPGTTQEDLAKELCLNKSTVARSLTHLEEQGYVLRKPNPTDKRQMLVFPTEKMLAVYPKVRELSAEWLGQISKGIEKEELETFYSVLSRLADRAKELIDT